MTTLEPRLGHLYRQPDGTILIAEDNGLHPIHGGPGRYMTGSTVIHGIIGSENWNAAMLQARTTLLASFEEANRRRQAIQTKYDNLGEALLEEAERRGWCSEYEEFAEEWDLPKRTRDYVVCINVVVNAKDGDEAKELALGGFRNYEYDVDVEEQV